MAVSSYQGGCLFSGHTFRLSRVAPMKYLFYVPAKDEEGSSCGQSAEALSAFPSGLHHWAHLQLSGQGKLRKMLLLCVNLFISGSFTN